MTPSVPPWDNGRAQGQTAKTGRDMPPPIPRPAHLSHLDCLQLLRAPGCCLPAHPPAPIPTHPTSCLMNSQPCSHKEYSVTGVPLLASNSEKEREGYVLGYFDAPSHLLTQSQHCLAKTFAGSQRSRREPSSLGSRQREALGEASPALPHHPISHSPVTLPSYLAALPPLNFPEPQFPIYKMEPVTSRLNCDSGYRTLTPACTQGVCSVGSPSHPPYCSCRQPLRAKCSFTGRVVCYVICRWERSYTSTALAHSNL